MNEPYKINIDFSGVVEFFKNQPIVRAYIFGSYVRGDFKKDSDIDILVELEKGTDLFKFIKIKQQLEKLINKTVDLISSNGLSPRIKTFIDKEKVLIYEK
jgi:uncharacterized protein